MTLTDHLVDDALSALLDDQLAPAELSAARAHIAGCPGCAERLAELRQVVGLLRGLPMVEPPRDFALGPRLVAEPPNVVRLQRWYTWARAGAASLAAVFVFLVAGSMYVDSTGAPKGANNALVANDARNAPTTLAVAPAAQPAAQPPPPVAQAPQSAARAQSAAGAAAAESSATKAAPEASDQVAAATSVRALPTQIPVPTPLPLATQAPPATADPAAPLRIAALVAGALAALAVLLALIVRRRLVRSRAPNLILE